jgi:ribonuclease D
MALRFDLAPGVLCPNGTLEAIARLNPSSVEQLAGVPELRRWQLRELGEEFVQALRPPTTT